MEKIQQNISLAPYTTFHVGGYAKYFAEATSADDVSEALQFAREKNLPVFVLGTGSNILISDDGFKAAIAAGIAIVHINTEIRIAYRKGIQLSLQEDADEIAPYRFMKGGLEAVEKVVSDRLKLFANLSNHV